MDSIKYAGDGAKKSIDEGLKQASTFMADADEGTSFEDVQNASVKWELANNSNNRELSNKARNEMIGHLSKENKEIYLKDAEPLQKYIDAKDEFDYKNNNYTTTEFIDTTPNEDVREVQRELNELGYTDKFGEPLKEDGIFGGKTRYAKDSYDVDNGYKPTSISDDSRYNISTLSYLGENTSQRFGNRMPLTSRGGNIRSVSTSNVTESQSAQSVVKNKYLYNKKIAENATLNNKSKYIINKASNIISRNSETIKKAGKKYGVNPSIIATCIYSEQILNVNITDVVKDQMYWDNPSVGIGQVSIETAKTIENYGNIEPITYAGKRKEWHANGCVLKDAWNVPGCGIITGTREYAIYYRLNNETQCIEYVAAYLQIIQDLWREKYPIIDGKSDVLSTLYNIGEYGEKKGINSNPEPNYFGVVSKQNYYHMQYLLDIE